MDDELRIQYSDGEEVLNSARNGPVVIRLADQGQEVTVNQRLRWAGDPSRDVH